MYINKKRITIAALQALMVGATGVALPAVAQTAPPQTLERVVVTGSNIKRVETETASPIQIITREEVEKSGKSTVAEYLQSLAVDGAGSLPTSFGTGFAAGGSAISLRGLGATSTLVLLNGRRMAPFARADDGQKTFTDLSTIPMEAVDRIEILKDGASSIYGADAIAGVVNIILRTDYVGVAAKASYGTSRYSDGDQTRVSLTVGFGKLEADRFNVLFNVEMFRSQEIHNKDRLGRDWIGASDLRPWGYPLATQYAFGYINGNNSANNSGAPNGLIRNPTTLDYVGLPGCAQFSVSSPQDPRGGCVWHSNQFRSMQPKIESINLYGRGTMKLSSDVQAYAELGYSNRETGYDVIPPGITPTIAFLPSAANPSGVINYGSGAGTTMVLAATHPQNPYGVPVRVRYAAFDVGPQRRQAENDFIRAVAGIKGTAGGWDFDAAFVHSETKLHLDWSGILNMKVVAAALGNPASQYFPYYIGAQANRNPASLYAAMVRNATSDSTTKLDLIDAKASRELFSLPGGPLALAVGAEYRKEKLNNPSLSGTETGDVNISYVAAKGDQTISAVYAEVLAPVIKSVELTGAVRYDKYDQFNSTTPKAGIKWTPIQSLAVRGTYSEGFRAPGPAESSPTSQSTGTATVRDPVRCPSGTPLAGASTADCALAVAAVKVGDPNLKPEKSKGYTLGIVWEPISGTSAAVDYWRIKRSDEINPLPYNEAAALPTAIRADNNLTINGAVVPNTGTLLISKAPYKNSSYTEIKGIDVDLRQRLSLGTMGRATFELHWTHIQSWLRVESATVQYQFVGTHGNCDTSNCAGTPKDKVNIALSWDYGNWNLTGIVNYRGPMQNVLFKGDLCASRFADGSDAPNGCKISSFTTLDLSTRWNVNKNLQLFGSIANVFDRVAPLDPLTYGAMSYNPMDYSGAIGRFFRVGLKYQFM